MDRMQEYYKNSLLANLCSEYKGHWQASMQDKEKLFVLAMQQQSIPHLLTFANNGIGLTKEYLKDEFENYINGKYKAIDADGVKGDYKSTLYVDCDHKINTTDDVMTFMWCDAQLEVQETKATKLYIGCQSNVKVTPQGYNTIIIMLFDESKVRIDECDTFTNINIYRYGQQTAVEIDKYCLAKVKIHEKELRL